VAAAASVASPTPKIKLSKVRKIGLQNNVPFRLTATSDSALDPARRAAGGKYPGTAAPGPC